MVGRDHDRRLPSFDDGAGVAVAGRKGRQHKPFGGESAADRLGRLKGRGGAWAGVADGRFVSQGPRGGGGGLDRGVVVADDPVAHPTAGGGLPIRAGGGRRPRRGARGQIVAEVLDQTRRDAGGDGAKALEEIERDLRLGRRWHAGAGGDEVERVADDVGEDEDDEPSGGAGPGQAPRLHGARPAADGVEGADVGTGAGEETRDGDLVVEREPVARRGQQRRPAAADQRHRQIGGPEAPEARHHRGGCRDDARRGEIHSGGTGLTDLDRPEFPATPLRDADETRETLRGKASGGQVLFEPRGHRGGGLAGSDDDDPAGRQGPEEIGQRQGEEPLRGDGADRLLPDPLRVSAEAMPRRHHSPGGG